MIDYRKYILDNGLTLLTHEAWDTPLASTCLLYGVGSRNEEPTRTGFAHLFEHLMFGGTRAVPDFDGVVNGVGGESNAFTNCDYTCYYMTVPSEALETALALEADRMMGLELTQKALEVQQRVVTEEYHQRYMNQPYGDVWLLLRPLCYGKDHPYGWPTIGADIRHVSEATLDDVRAFHAKYYRPDNAILAVAAPMKHEELAAMVSASFSSGIGVLSSEFGVIRVRQQQLCTPNSELRTPRMLRVKRPVPATKVFLAYNIGAYTDPMYRAYDLITDILGNGPSSRMYRQLVVESGMMSEADAYLSGDMGPGLLVLSGTLANGVTPEEGVEALREFGTQMSKLPRQARQPQHGVASTGSAATAQSCLDRLGSHSTELFECGSNNSALRTPSSELEKVQNKYENTFVFSQYRAADRAYGLCHYTWLGDTSLVNREPELYRRVTVDDIAAAATKVFQPQNENILIYEAERDNS